ncbi:GGDEF domain-containing protein [Thiopseudomonas acetoxidans]|uniref:Bifunctional diguanylate cyclase/phosphodiesterase n=1 Tax=Thiopseudomonas acetoxidans TaxID=3041622 RepID=A0ABT7SQ61_9GAMM|nr:bifunctional diguanylate cyclase/phosphodiesterase [Thiopseudomonas sp. CY1220]MDM7858320.1 bifunctional diguanylate cyclase/phosphodiesterase [Thiopseudomonas sp. CY1220]
MQKENELLIIINEKMINTYFQPIISADGQSIYAYEALSRGPSGSIFFSPINLFEQAKQQQKLFALESVCRTQAVATFTQQQLPGKLFLNVSPDTLLQPDHHRGFTLELINTFGISPEQVVIEITEHSPTHDYELMRRAVKHYQAEGFSIALDDLGSGYSSLRLWSEVQPDFVKIDRHFINGIEKDRVKRDFVRSIIDIARSVNSQVIAEGIETLQEFETLSELGVDYLQGYYFAKPSPIPAQQISKSAQKIWQQVKQSREIYQELEQIGQLKLDVSAIAPDLCIEEVVSIFESNEHWHSLPVVADGVVIGVIRRSQLLQTLSKPFGRDLYVKKAVRQVLDDKFISVERHTRLEVVSQLVVQRNRQQLQDDFIITEQGQYFGVGQVIDLLKMMTAIQVKNAKNANPLTGLPGNLLIQEHIDQLIASKKPFVACYFDLDNFKPYNDQYGYAKGDVVLLGVAQLLQKHCQPELDFVGHVGGDDYVVVFRSSNWQSYVQAALDEFRRQCCSFYNSQHLKNNGIWAEDRFGEKRFFNLMSISVAAIDSTSTHLDSAATVSSRLSRIKAEAKNTIGNSLVAELSGAIVHLPTGFEHPQLKVGSNG